ncbi:hypothetical protein Tco_0879576, partial [Tanacetum coccineum]
MPRLQSNYVTHTGAKRAVKTCCQLPTVSTNRICISGCEVHRRGSTYFAAFLATELESTSDASPEPEEPADDTHHSNINRTKAEDR